MIGLILMTGIIGVVAAVSAVIDPNSDRARLARARRTLRASGRRYRKDSDEERRALRVLLEGESVDRI